MLVPIVGGDISIATLDRARAALAHPDARLVLVHVERPAQLADRAECGPADGWDADVPRWRRLAASVPTDRLFVDAALGEPAEVILSQARRAGSDLIVLDHPDVVERVAPRVPTRRHPTRRHHVDRPRAPHRRSTPRRERSDVG